MSEDLKSFCIKCGQSRFYDSKGACNACGSIIASPHIPIRSKKLQPATVNSNGATSFIDPDDLETVFVGVYVLSCITFLLGIFLPFVTILKQISFAGVTVFSEQNTVSMLSGIWSLLRDRHMLLFFVLLLFSIVFPLLKLVILYPICCDRGDEQKTKKHLKFLSLTGKWSMLDVVVIGILVVTLKLGDMVEVKIHSGIYFFTASVLLTMLLSSFAGKSRA